ncbi:MAG: hypothetical protein MUC93_10185 [Bacteroidales bacterium]|jgi:hypothetical protein|nr:hypothetical protein [Bacteroidales bacterium]
MIKLSDRRISKKTISFLFFGIITSSLINAQEPVRELAMRNLIDSALQRNYLLQANEKQTAIKQSEIELLKINYQPRIAASANVSYWKWLMPNKAKILGNTLSDVYTGIFGTQFFLEVLAENGLNELAFEAMNKTTEPSYGWWIEQGATATWEQWDGSGSRNHPMFGGGLVWFYRVLAGMNTDPEEPGDKHIQIKPQPAGNVTFVTYSNETPYGSASVSGKRNDGKFDLDITVPVGCTADVYVPASDASVVTEGGKSIQGTSDLRFARMEDGYAVFKIGSGDYKISSYL